MYLIKLYAKYGLRRHKVTPSLHVSNGQKNFFGFVKWGWFSFVRFFVRLETDPGVVPILRFENALGPKICVRFTQRPGIPFPVPFLKLPGSTRAYFVTFMWVRRTGDMVARLFHPDQLDPPKPRQRMTFMAFEPAETLPDMRDVHRDFLQMRKADIEADDGFRGKLRRLRLAERGPNQDEALRLEAKVFLFANVYRNFNDARISLRRIMKIREEQGQPELFDQFVEHLNTAMAPRAIGAHGYSVQMRARDQADVMERLRPLIDTIEAEGYPVFINSGTLLGFHRDNRMIDHDDDVDFGVYYGEGDEATIVARQKALHAKLRADFNVVFKTYQAFLGLGLQGGPGIDLFPAWSNNGRFYVYPYLHGELATDEVLPLSEHEWLKTTVKTPKDIETVLEYNYGPNWRTPEPMWRFMWHDAYEKFGSFLDITMPGRHKD